MGLFRIETTIEISTTLMIEYIQEQYTYTSLTILSGAGTGRGQARHEPRRHGGHNVSNTAAKNSTITKYTQFRRYTSQLKFLTRKT